MILRRIHLWLLAKAALLACAISFSAMADMPHESASILRTAADSTASAHPCAQGTQALDPLVWKWIKVKSMRATNSGLPAPSSPEAKQYHFYVNGTYFDYRPGRDFDILRNETKALRGFLIAPTPKGIDQTPSTSAVACSSGAV